MVPSRSAATGTVAENDALRRTADTVRILTADAVQRANCGHPGLPMGMADAAVVLWSTFLKYDPTAPNWPDRDRFVLSAGHGSMLLYALLHLSGYDLPLAELQRFRQWDSRTPGHPERGVTPGVETTTGPLGQGIANAVGMAMGERILATHFNRPEFPIIDHRTFVIASDGDMMEGVSHEACALAGHLGLGKLIVLYDDNGISIDGPAALAFTEDVTTRFSAYGWQTLRVDGHDIEAVGAAIRSACTDGARPSLIACRTEIGHGSPNRAGTNKAHGEPLGAEEVRLVKERLGWPAASEFLVPEMARMTMRRSAMRGTSMHALWRAALDRYRQRYPDLAAELDARLEGTLPRGWDSDLPTFTGDKPIATRTASGATINVLATHVPALIGGSADLTPSNNTQPTGHPGESIARDAWSGRYIRFGVREHGMGSILNGLALHGGLHPYGGTFLVFSDYMRPAIRMAALMHLPVIFVFTHDSIGLGEDGPTHQPVEHLTALRAIPNLVVFRPADAAETVEGWRCAILRRDGPTALILTRQPLPVLDRSQYALARGAARGAYVVADPDDPQAILIGTGSELHIALGAARLLAADGVRARVVSMPSRELFEAQPEAYRNRVLPPDMRARVVIEAGSTLGWGGYAGLDGVTVGLDHFGASAPCESLYREFGLTADAVVAAVRDVIARVWVTTGRATNAAH
jgi:transketolase